VVVGERFENAVGAVAVEEARLGVGVGEAVEDFAGVDSDAGESSAGGVGGVECDCEWTSWYELHYRSGGDWALRPPLRPGLF